MKRKIICFIIIIIFAFFLKLSIKELKVYKRKNRSEKFWIWKSNYYKNKDNKKLIKKLILYSKNKINKFDKSSVSTDLFFVNVLKENKELKKINSKMIKLDENERSYYIKLLIKINSEKSNELLENIYNKSSKGMKNFINDQRKYEINNNILYLEEKNSKLNINYNQIILAKYLDNKLILSDKDIQTIILIQDSQLDLIRSYGSLFHVYGKTKYIDKIIEKSSKSNSKNILERQLSYYAKLYLLDEYINNSEILEIINLYKGKDNNILFELKDKDFKSS